MLMVEENIRNAQIRLKKLHNSVDKNIYSRNNVYIFTTLHVELRYINVLLCLCMMYDSRGGLQDETCLVCVCGKSDWCAGPGCKYVFQTGLQH